MFKKSRFFKLIKIKILLINKTLKDMAPPASSLLGHDSFRLYPVNSLSISFCDTPIKL